MKKTINAIIVKVHNVGRERDVEGWRQVYSIRFISHEEEQFANSYCTS